MKFVITEEEKNYIINLYKLIKEDTIDDYLKPSETQNTEALVGYLKSAGIDNIPTFKKNCLSVEECYFKNNEVKKLEPRLNDTWDVLADKCWRCYGEVVTRDIRTNELKTNKFEELKPFCQSLDADDVDYQDCRFTWKTPSEERSFINVSLEKRENGIIYLFFNGILLPNFVNDPNNQNLMNALKPYGKTFRNGVFNVQKEIHDLTPIIEIFKGLKTT